MIDEDRMGRALTRNAEGIEAVEEQLRRLRQVAEESLAAQQRHTEEMRTQNLIAYLHATQDGMSSDERAGLETWIRDRLGI